MSETDLLMSAFKQGYNEAKEQARERITELERREKHLEEMLNGWRDEAKKADARIAELEAALKPFANAWDEKETWQWQINIDDLRAARAALNGEKK